MFRLCFQCIRLARLGVNDPVAFRLAEAWGRGLEIWELENRPQNHPCDYIYIIYIYIDNISISFFWEKYVITCSLQP